MNLGDLSLACATALVDELIAAGIRHACLSPGSRSTPLALALDRHPGVELHVHLDERSSAFVAVGIAKATGRPAIVATTSGTAAAELLPAVVEASQSRTPLVLVTADRPPRVRGTGANQTILQPGLFGDYVRATLDLPVPTTEGHDAWWRQAASEALESLNDHPTGPVHLNCPFEEPLTPGADIQPVRGARKPLDRPARDEAELDPDEAERLRNLVSGARGAIVIGGWPGELAEEAAFWSNAMGWPVLAEPTSGARRSPVSALRAPQALISSPTWIAGHEPDLVIQFGAHPTSRATEAFVASAEQLVVADRWHLDPDPERLATWRLAVDPGALRRALTVHPLGDASVHEAASEPEDRSSVRGMDPAPIGWLDAWLQADVRADSTLHSIFLESDEPFEPRVAREVAAWIPEGGHLFVGNSTPIRDLDLAMTPRGGITILANRGASGIDGLVSTAIGVSAAQDGPTVALLGDLSVLHDAGALLWNATRGVDLTIVVLNNRGGHVFSLLPQRELPEHERLFVTPHAVDIGTLCRAAGAGHEPIQRARELLPALDRAADAGGLNVVEVVVDAELGLRRRQELRDEIDRVLTA
jgi:2-succinyl-5-enolpyruvyl-6-hydroxy-3-cyclohexene-1-carboxylate synthase